MMGNARTTWCAAWLLLAGCPGTETDTDGGSPFAVVTQEQASAFLSVHGTSAMDVWVVGSDDGTGPAVLHFDGTTWTRLDTGERGDLWWVHATSDRVTMVGGAREGSGPTEEGLILEYDRATATFSRHPGPPGITLFGVWGASADEMWTVGGDVMTELAPIVWRRDGSAWTAIESDALGAISAPDLLYKVHGTGADDVYMVGTSGIVLHWDGGQLLRETAPTTSTLFTVHTGGPTPVAVGGFGQATVLHREDGAWLDRSPEFQPQTNGVCGRDDTLIAVGRQGSVHRFVSGNWQTDPGQITTRDLHAVWIDDEGGIWTVGGALSGSPLSAGVIAYDGPRPMEEL